MSKLTTTKLSAILQERVRAEITPGYNYTLMTLRCAEKEVAVLVNLLRERKEGIEATYLQRVEDAPEGWSLLPYTCVPMEHGVWVPIKFETRVNVLSEVLAELLPDVEFAAPSWA